MSQLLKIDLLSQHVAG